MLFRQDERRTKVLVFYRTLPPLGPLLCFVVCARYLIIGGCLKFVRLRSNFRLEFIHGGFNMRASSSLLTKLSAKGLEDEMMGAMQRTRSLSSSISEYRIRISRDQYFFSFIGGLLLLPAKEGKGITMKGLPIKAALADWKKVVNGSFFFLCMFFCVCVL